MRVRLGLYSYLMIVLLLLLQSCAAPVSVAGSVATSGAQALYNNQSLQKTTTDQYITFRAYQAVDIDSDHFKDANINISTFNRIVLLSGQAPNAWQKTEAEQKVKKIPNIDHIYNLITVEKPTTQMARLQDTWITTKIKAKLLASSELDATQIKVITEKRRVYLMGFLRPSEARAAVNTARTTDGVEEVVRVFSYLNLSKVPAEG